VCPPLRPPLLLGRQLRRRKQPRALFSIRLFSIHSRRIRPCDGHNCPPPPRLLTTQTSSLFHHADDVPSWLRSNGLPLILFLVLFLHWVMLISLVVSHAYLAITNQTTWEAMRKSSISYLRGVPQGVFPFSRGACWNLKTFFAPLFRTTPPLEWVPAKPPYGPAHQIWCLENEYYSCC
jgi:hypothetical protein